jgi:hypothetical protein
MSLVDTALGIGSLVIGNIVVFSVGYIALREKVAKLEQCIEAHDSDLVIIKSKLDDIISKVSVLGDRSEMWQDAIKNSMIDILHHPNNPERDILLERLKDKTITVYELEKLTDILKVDALDRNGTKGDERAAAGILYSIVITFLFECQKKGAATLLECQGPINEFHTYLLNKDIKNVLT